MSTDTGLEAQVRAHLAMTVEPVTPRPDPYGRLMRRRHQGWLRRAVLAGVTTLAATAAGTFVALAPAGSPPPTPRPERPDGYQGWVEDLAYAPPRGGLAGDEAFTQELTDRVIEAVRTNPYHPDLLDADRTVNPEQEVRLLFADDIDDQRIALLALLAPTAVDPSVGRVRVAWIAGPRGAPASLLAQELTSRPGPDVESGSDSARPFHVAVLGEDGAVTTMIGIAPPGCSVSTAPATEPTGLRPEPTGSYIVRTSGADRLEYWQVTCDGVVRERTLPPWHLSEPSPEVVDAALEGAAGLSATDRASDDVRRKVSRMIQHFSLGADALPTGAPRVLWAGRPPGIVPAGAWVTVAVAPAPGQSWIGVVEVIVGSGAGGTRFHLRTDPTAEGFLLAVSIGSSGTDPPALIMVVTPPAVATVRLLAADETPLAESVVVDRGTTLAVPLESLLEDHEIPEGLHVVAYDAGGAPVATTALAGYDTALEGEGQVFDWS